MSFPVRKIWTKLSRMSWDEFRTRVRQEAGKRLEFAFSRVGLIRDIQLHEVHGPGGEFFFRRDEVGSRVELIREHIPASVDAVLSEADEILHHRFNVLGYRNLDYGTEIDWHLDAVNKKHAPLKPWYKVPFLSFDRVGDHKVTWELNRHQHLVTLAKAFAFTHDPKYVHEIRDQFYSWQRANPYPMGINWGSSLEVAFRSLSWIWVRALIAEAASDSTSFDHDLVCGLARNGAYIERYLSTYFSPNTHLLGEALALFFIGTLCPEIPFSQRWGQRGFNILLGEMQRQVRADGVYFEQSLYYHVYALDIFLHARALAQSNHLKMPDSFDAMLKKMLLVVDVLSREGPPQGFGDDDGGRLFDPLRNRAEHMTDPLALGTCVWDDLATHSRPLTEESIWMFGSRAVSASRKVPTYSGLESRCFEEGGLYVIGSDTPIRSQMLIDAGPHGTGHGGHGHADALSIRLSVEGQPWLIDPGTYVYMAADDSRNEFRGTLAHNTLRVDSEDQAVPQTPFSWSAIPKVATERWLVGEGFSLFSGSHTGYTRLPDPVLHHRTIFHLNGEYWIVLDLADGRSNHKLEISWHFAPGSRLLTGEGTLTATQGGRQLALLMAEPWNCSLTERFCSPAYGQKEAAASAVVTSCAQLPAQMATLIVPFKSRLGSFTKEESSGASRSYVYEHADNTDQVVFGSGEQWSSGPIKGDAEFLFVRRSGKEVTALICCSATQLEIDEQRVFSFPHRVERLEWTSGSGASASDRESIKFLREDLLRAGNAVR
jgi:hypothetical protein